MSKKQQTIFWPSVLVIACGVAVILVLSARTKNVASTRPESPTAITATPDQPEFKQRIRIWIHGDDIRPKVIHASPGKIVISVENETKADLSLRIERQNPTSSRFIDTMNLPAKAKRLQHEVNLGVGEYSFYEASRPDIRGRLIVELH